MIKGIPEARNPNLPSIADTMKEEAYNQAIEDTHHVLANYYNEKLEANEINAKRNISRTIRELKERIEELKKNSQQKKCSDTPTQQHRPGTHPEEGKVSKENEGANVDTK